MIQVVSSLRMDEMEQAIAAAAQRHNGSVLGVTHFGALLHIDAADTVVFTICHADLDRVLLNADVRFAAFLPSRIAVLQRANGVLLETISPRQFCRLIRREDLEAVAAPLEEALRAIMQDAAQPRASAAAHAQTGGRWGATEDQVNLRATVAQRLDGKGTKVDDLAGTGKGEALGG